jgi:hypothetical protein
MCSREAQAHIKLIDMILISDFLWFCSKRYDVLKFFIRCKKKRGNLIAAGHSRRHKKICQIGYLQPLKSSGYKNQTNQRWESQVLRSGSSLNPRWTSNGGTKAVWTYTVYMCGTTAVRKQACRRLICAPQVHYIRTKCSMGWYSNSWVLWASLYFHFFEKTLKNRTVCMEALKNQTSLRFYMLVWSYSIFLRAYLAHMSGDTVPLNEDRK